MGNDPGQPVRDGEESTVHIRIKGRLDEGDAKQFKKELDDLVAKYGACCKSGGGMSVPIKKK
jgi:hypothetical protein